MNDSRSISLSFSSSRSSSLSSSEDLRIRYSRKAPTKKTKKRTRIIPVTQWVRDEKKKKNKKDNRTYPEREHQLLKRKRMYRDVTSSLVRKCSPGVSSGCLRVSRRAFPPRVRRNEDGQEAHSEGEVAYARKKRERGSNNSSEWLRN